MVSFEGKTMALNQETQVYNKMLIDFATIFSEFNKTIYVLFLAEQWMNHSEMSLPVDTSKIKYKKKNFKKIHHLAGVKERKKVSQ